MESKDTLDEYYRVFKAQVDTIEAHGGTPGYHGAVYREHYEALTISKGYDPKEKLDAVGDAEVPSRELCPSKSGHNSRNMIVQKKQKELVVVCWLPRSRQIRLQKNWQK